MRQADYRVFGSNRVGDRVPGEYGKFGEELCANRARLQVEVDNLKKEVAEKRTALDEAPAMPQKEEMANQKAYEDLKAAKEEEIAAGQAQIDARWGAQRYCGRRPRFHSEGGECTPEARGFTYLASGHKRIHHGTIGAAARSCSRIGQCDTMPIAGYKDEGSCPKRQLAGWLAALARHLVLSSARYGWQCVGVSPALLYRHVAGTKIVGPRALRCVPAAAL